MAIRHIQFQDNGRALLTVDGIEPAKPTNLPSPSAVSVQPSSELDAAIAHVQKSRRAPDGIRHTLAELNREIASVEVQVGQLEDDRSRDFAMRKICPVAPCEKKLGELIQRQSVLTHQLTQAEKTAEGVASVDLDVLLERQRAIREQGAAHIASLRQARESALAKLTEAVCGPLSELAKLDEELRQLAMAAPVAA